MKREFKEIDDFLKLNRGKLIILKSKPSIALSTFALNIATNVALKANSSVAIFSLEMSKEQLVNRIISCETMIDIKKVRTAKLEDEDWKKIARTMKYLSEANIYIDDTIEISIEEIKNKCRKLKLEKNINLIIIDYLQLVRKNDEYNFNSKKEILEICKFFKILANELNIPIIVLSKQSTTIKQKTEHKSTYLDLCKSNNLEEDADIVMCLYKLNNYKNTDLKNIMELNISENNNDKIKKIHMSYIPEYCKFIDFKN